jgi:hypothetical protein
LSPICPWFPEAAKKFHCHKNIYDEDALTLDNGNRVHSVGIDTTELKKRMQLGRKNAQKILPWQRHMVDL